MKEKQMRVKNFECPKGYRLVTEEKIKEVNGTVFYFEHIQTGARIIYVSNQDNNKVFTIGFKTPSKNSTGVAHIMEHSVLCGSAKYPVKEPFVELAKGSLNTFLNAMTYPDKTVYPIASTNDQDFMNLMEVYLDAVFHPAIYEKREIFMQEGWHYHIESEEAPIIYNGVVYNEMKGVYSSPEEIMWNAMFKALYPDTIYSGESGGYPENIPDLTYEDFLAFHKTFYHPSNSYVYFYGDGDIAKHLEYLDREYLSHYGKQTIDATIPCQQAFEERAALKAYYPVSAGESTDQRDYLALGWVLDGSRYEDMLMLDILGHILLENNSAPLKKALQELNICKEVDYTLSVSLQQPYFAIVLKNTDETQEQCFIDTVYAVLQQLAEEGLDARDVEAGINSAEFTLREGESGLYPKGLVMGLELFDSWLYDDDMAEGFKPFDHLKYEKALTSIRERAANRGFEKMIETCFLNNSHQAVVKTVPDTDLGERQERLLREKLAAYKASLSHDELMTLIDETKTLLAHQNEEDSPEALATIPRISLGEIDPKARQNVLIEESFEGHPLLWHPAETNGIVYVKLYFDIHAAAPEELSALSLLNKYLCELETEDYSLTELIREIEIHTGGISGTLSTIDHTRNVGDYAAYLMIRGKAVADRVPKLMALIGSIIRSTRFEDERMMRDIIGEIRLDLEERFLTAGHQVSVHRLQSYYSASAKLYDVLNGIGFYRYIKNLDDHFEECLPALKEQLTDLMKKVFSRQNMVISLTCEEDCKANALSCIESLLTTLPEAAPCYYDYSTEVTVHNEGFKTAAKIQYVAKGYNFRALGYDYHGSLPVLKSLLYTDYLWTRVRVQGGAYGGMIGITRAGELYFTSYRDPNLAKTLEVYDQTASYLEQLSLSESELEKYIIGTISSKDTPLSPALAADAADVMYFNGTSAEDVQRERDEILATTVDDLKATSALIADCMAQHCLCVIGGEEAVEKNQELFYETTFLLGDRETE